MLEGVAVSVFDGVLLVPVDGAPQLPAVGTQVNLPRGGNAVVVRPPGLPERLDGLDGHPPVAVRWLRHTDSVSTRSPRQRDGCLRQDAGAGVRLLPPVATGDLPAVEPLQGGRTHLALTATGRTLCERLPLRGAVRPTAWVDCPGCLEAPALARRLEEQLAALPALAALAGPLTAAAAARLWLRPAPTSAPWSTDRLDAAVGANRHRLPGAPALDAILRLLADHAGQVSPAAQAWAATRLRHGLSDAVARQRGCRDQRRTGTALTTAVELTAALLPPAEAAELLVDVLTDHGPLPALEPTVLAAAERAGAAVSPRVERWRRLHQVARALGPDPATRSPRQSLVSH